MTIPTPENPFPPEPSQEPPPPYPDMSSFPLTKPINLAQLREEIRAEVRDNLEIAQVGPKHPGDISESNPAILAVTPSRIPEGKVRKVIKDHKASADYDVPKSEREFAAVVKKVVDDPQANLGAAETQSALRGLLMRSASTHPVRRREDDLLN